MAGKRLKDPSLTRTTYLEALANNAELLTDWNGLTLARPIPVKYIGNARWQGSNDGITWSDTLVPEHTFARATTDGGQNWMVFNMNASDETHPALSLGTTVNGLQLDSENQVLNLNYVTYISGGAMRSSDKIKLDALKHDEFEDLTEGYSVYANNSTDEFDIKTHYLRPLVPGNGISLSIVNDAIEINATGGGEGGTLIYGRNVGLDGQSVFDANNLPYIDLRSIAPGSNKVSVTLDGTNKAIDIDLNESNINHDSLLNYLDDEHVNHSLVSITGTEGVEGGGNLSTSSQIKLAYDTLTEVTSVNDNDIVSIYIPGSDVHRKIKFTNFNKQSEEYFNTLYPLLTRKINTVDGIKGGGDLSVDRTLSLDIINLQTITYSDNDFIAVYDISTSSHGKIPLSSIIGSQGPQGDIGLTGATGDTGSQGPQGATGSEGPKGDQGDNGTDGTNGAQGPQGERGYQGFQGNNGTNGVDGLAGPQGPQGEVGQTGPQGTIGNIGPQGYQGDDGGTGPQGNDGTGVNILGSVADSDEFTGSVKYGYLYNWYAVTDARNIANTNWHVPTQAEITTLKDYLGATTAGGQMKEIGFDYWDSPNTGATNSSAFNARGTGLRGETGIFSAIKTIGDIWVTTEFDSTNAYQGSLANTHAVFNTTSYANKKRGKGVRLVKDSTTLSHGQTGTYVGNDNRIYRTICIGTQEWLADNLAETLYRDGVSIPDVTSNATWTGLTTGARCSYDNTQTNAIDPGSLTNYVGNPGDGYINDTDGHLWVWNGSSWVDVGLVRGPQGPQGTQGVIGNQGVQGSIGVQGVQGVQGNQGYQGVTGSKGDQGNQGNTGNTGATGPQGVRGYQGYQGYQGNQGTVGSTGTQGYQGNTGSTGPQGLRGYQGNQGNDGSTGDAGPQGSTGSTGPQGTDGNTWHSGTVSPSSSLGVSGDFYFRYNYGYVYEKTSSSAWTYRTNLTGAQGSQGTPGSTGPQGNQGYQGTTGGKWYTGSSLPSPGTGTSGDMYLRTDGGDIFQKSGLTWYQTGNIKGPQGFQGSTGPQGSIGSRGYQGYQGQTGDSMWYDAGTHLYPINTSRRISIGKSSNYGSSVEVGGIVAVTSGNGFGNNITYNGGWKYVSAGYGSFIKQETNSLVFYVAGSGSTNGTATLSSGISINNSTRAVTMGGTATATNFILSSERSLKDNIESIESTDLSRIDDIPLHSFTMKGDSRKRYGIIVDEVEDKFPEFIYESDNGKQVAYIDFLVAKVARLEQRIAKLEN